MAEAIKRLHYFDHQFLRDKDFTDEQAYHMGKRRRHNQHLHTWGIADGLDVEFEHGASRVTVKSGLAFDGLGREIVLLADRELELSGFPADAALYVTIAYHEEQKDSTDEMGVEGNTRWEETPRIEASESKPEPTDLDRVLILGKVIRKGTEVTEVEASERRYSGVVAGDLEARSLVLKREGVGKTKWPRLHQGAADRADLEGSLRVSGDLEVDGDITGRGMLTAYLTYNGETDKVQNGQVFGKVDKKGPGSYQIQWKVKTNKYGPVVCWTYQGFNVRCRGISEGRLAVEVRDASGQAKDDTIYVMAI